MSEKSIYFNDRLKIHSFIFPSILTELSGCRVRPVLQGTFICAFFSKKIY